MLTRFTKVLGLFVAMVVLNASPAFAADQLESLSKRLATETAELTAIRSQLEAGSGDQVALEFRRDEQTLAALKVFVRLAEVVVNASEGEEKAKYLAEVSQVNNGLDGAITGRLNALEELIAQRSEAASASSGAEGEAAHALVMSLQTLRNEYLSTMIDIASVRADLGLPEGDLAKVAGAHLLADASALMGEINLADGTIAALEKREALNPANTDIKDALVEAQAELAESVQVLGGVVAAMDRLGLDTERANRLLLGHTKAISGALLSGDNAGNLISDWQNEATTWIEDSALSIVLQVLLFIGIMILAKWLAKFTKSATDRVLTNNAPGVSNLLRDVLVSLVGGIVLTIGLLVALSQMGISVAPMLAGLGVAGFVIGFALQDTLGNFAAGAMILAYRPFDMGDYVEVGGVEGSVKKMTLVSTTVTTPDNKTLIVPNSKIWGDVIRNFSYQDNRRVDIEFGIGYDDDIDKAEAILNEIIAGVPAILPDPAPVIRLHRLGESSVDFVTRSWVKKEDYWETYWTLLKTVKKRFDAEGISIPFPQRDVHHYYPDGKAE